MNIRSTQLFIILLSSALCSAGTDHFIHTYAVDPAIVPILDDHSKILAKKVAETHRDSQKWGVWQFDWLPGYYLKYGLARIIGLEKMQKAINSHNLEKIEVPDKRLYHIKGRPTKLSNLNYLIVVKAVKPARDVPPITLDEIQQLCTIMHKTGYISMTGTGTSSKKGPNYIRTQDGKFCLIDTESRYDHAQLLKGFLRLLSSHDLNKDLSQEALKHVLWEIKQLLIQQPRKVADTLLEIKRIIRKQDTLPTWNYRSYVKDYFAKLRTQSHL